MQLGKVANDVGEWDARDALGLVACQVFGRRRTASMELRGS